MSDKQEAGTKAPVATLGFIPSDWPSPEMVEFGALILRYWQLHAPEQPEKAAREVFRAMVMVGQRLASGHQPHEAADETDDLLAHEGEIIYLDQAVPRPKAQPVELVRAPTSKIARLPSIESRRQQQI